MTCFKRLDIHFKTRILTSLLLTCILLRRYRNLFQKSLSMLRYSQKDTAGNYPLEALVEGTFVRQLNLSLQNTLMAHKVLYYSIRQFSNKSNSC